MSLIKKYLTAIAFFIVIFSINAKAERCEDHQLTDGSYPITYAGMDTTTNWWAVAQPFANNYKMIINGKESRSYYDVTAPIFSSDGKRYAFFAKDGSSVWLVTEQGESLLDADDFGEAAFSSDSQTLLVTRVKGGTEFIENNGRSYEIINRTGKVYLSPLGDHVAFTVERGDMTYLVVDGREIAGFAELNPIGFWETGEFIYAAKTGYGYEIFRGRKSFGENYMSVRDIIVNRMGTAFGAIVQKMSGRYSSLVYTDEYYAPLEGREYDQAGLLALHPTDALISYTAEEQGRKFIVYSSVELASGDSFGAPQFTPDGSELLFAGCGMDCFLSVNGMQHKISAGIDVTNTFARAPESSTFAYVTGSSLVVQDFADNQLYSGKMYDKLFPARYNSRTRRYEALGLINGRLYMLTCSAF
ncbi:MAG: hypothetical protein ACM3U1_01490 [Chloroflexota bacterium]